MQDSAAPWQPYTWVLAQWFQFVGVFWFAWVATDEIAKSISSSNLAIIEKVCQFGETHFPGPI